MSASEFAFVRGVRVGLRGIRRQARARVGALVAIALVAVVLLGVFVAAMPLSATAGPSSVATAAPPTPAASHVAIAAFGPSAASAGCNGTINGSCIFSSLWNLFIGFFGSVVNTLEGAFSQIFGAFAGGISSMFQSWGFSLGAYNVWGPLMVVVSLGVAAFAAYMILDVMGWERDELGFTEDI